MIYPYNTFYYLQTFMRLYSYLNKRYMISCNFLFAFFVAAYIFINNYDINNNNAVRLYVFIEGGSFSLGFQFVYVNYIICMMHALYFSEVSFVA